MREKQTESQERVNIFSSLSLWMAAESDRGPGINTQAPIHPLAVWSTLNSGRRVIAAEGGEEGGETEEEGGGGGGGGRWLRNSTEEHVTPEQGIYILPLPLYSQAGAPPYFLVLFFFLKAKPADCDNGERKSKVTKSHVFM